MSEQIVANRIITPDGTELQSFHRHDYKEYTDRNGEVYMVDGGTSYLRRNICKVPYVEASLFANDEHHLIREYCAWGTRGKDGSEPLHWVKVKDLSTEHIKAILEGGIAYEWMQKILKDELAWREK